MKKTEAIKISATRYMDNHGYKYEEAIEAAEDDYNNDYLTVNIGRDVVEYAYYLCDNEEWAEDINGKELNKKEIEKLLNF